jgi:diguanylate cyclase (GGDEF)-like protein/PAS domain S-box-containing protein
VTQPIAQAESDMMYRLLVQGVTDYAIYMLSPAGMVANWNAGAQRAKGYTASEIVGRHFSCFYSEEDRAASIPERNLKQARDTGRFEDEGWRLRKDQTRFWAHVVIDAIHDEDGALLGFAKITRDCTEQRVTATQLKSMAENLDLAMSNISQGLCLLDADKRLILSNKRFSEILRADPLRALPGSAILPILSDAFGPVVTSDFDNQHLLLSAIHSQPVVSELVREDRTYLATTRALANGGWVSTLEDVTDRRRIETRIVHMAHHDALTNLLNRAAFHLRLEEAAAGAYGEAGFAVFYLDLDRFKPVNDTFGHGAGDALLKAVAKRLKSIFRQEDILARLGGDEFAVIVARQSERSELARIASRLVRELREPFNLGGVQVVIGGSIGIAVSSPKSATVDALLMSADLALYKAKHQGRNTYCFYQESMGELVVARRAREDSIRRALDAGEFELHYQPIVRLSVNRVIGFEALLRWRCPGEGLLSPSEFLPIAEDIGSMVEIGAWAIATACREAATWAEPLAVAVNISATQLRNMDLVSTVENALASSRLHPSRLEIEVTETAIMEDRDSALTTLGELRNLGVKIALDDFGTGYSSLSFVHSFPLTRIKIDRTFVHGLGKDPRSLAIVRSVISLSESMKVAVTAEGVESDVQRDILCREGCPEAQGFLFGKPQPKSADLLLLRSGAAG